MVNPVRKFIENRFENFEIELLWENKPSNVFGMYEKIRDSIIK
jgi:hypothetical protein